MSEDDYRLVVDGLTEPEALESGQIRSLGHYLLHHQPFLDLAKNRGREPQSLCGQINQFPFAENLHLFDAARLLGAQRAAAPIRSAPRPRAATSATAKPRKAANRR